MNEVRLEKLLDRYFDEALSPEEQRELETILLAWPQARALFWKRARFNSLLRRAGREQWGWRLAAEKSGATSPTARWRGIWQSWWESLRPAGWWAAASLAILIAIFLIKPWRTEAPLIQNAPSPALAGTPALPGTQGIATILRAVDVAWTGSVSQPGSVLGPGWLKFDRGLVELQFHRGARVILEGPAEFELITDMQARCLLGKVRAEVPPPAIGFEILSQNVHIVDRGTAFGLDVQHNGLAEIHVFSGQVDLTATRPPGATRELKQSMAVSVDSQGVFRDIPIGLEELATADSVEQRANSSMAMRFSAWSKQSQRLRNDPTLLVQYTFERGASSSRMLKNEAPNPPPGSDGTIVGCTWTDGRWPGKRALDFKRIGDRIRFRMDREHHELTCVMSIRLDAADRDYSAFLMSGDAAVGELQWQLRGIGAMVFGKRQIPGWGHGKVRNAETPQVFGPSRWGSWAHVAFVYNGPAGKVSMFLDGQELAARPMSADPLLITSALEIGNWTPVSGDPMSPIRAFNGRLDEFLMFSRALSPEEIQGLWTAGRPL